MELGGGGGAGGGLAFLQFSFLLLDNIKFTEEEIKAMEEEEDTEGRWRAELLLSEGFLIYMNHTFSHSSSLSLARSLARSADVYSGGGGRSWEEGGGA